jgi:hypothetical protein
MIETPYNAAQVTAAIKNPDFGCRQKTGIGSKFASHGLLAICLTWLQAGRPNHHVAGINVPDEARRQARARGFPPVPLVNLGEKDELKVTEQRKNAKTAYAISKPA